MKIAAIDIGTQSIHMVIVRVDKAGSFEIVDREKDMAKLGFKGLAEGRLTEEAIDTGIGSLKRMKKLSVAHGCDVLVAAATSAVRDASNRDKFIERAKKEIGLKIRILDGEEEADLIFRAVRDSTDLTSRKALVMDLGGGSTEFIVGNAFGTQLLHSLPIGVILMTDRFGGGSGGNYKGLAKEIRQLAEPVLDKARGIGFDLAVGTSGTFRSLAEMLGKPGRTPLGDVVHLPPLELKELDDFTEKLQRMDEKERLQIHGMNPKRADNIAVGATIVRELMRLAGIEQVIPSDKGLKDGLILQVIRDIPELEKALRDGPELRRRSVLALARMHQASLDHSSHVASLAAQIFDQTGGLHGLGPKERELLDYAALIHDVGLQIGYGKHHKHSYYIITNAELPGFAADEVHEMALVARYHRKNLPTKNDPEFADLGKKRQEAVSALSAILRIADGLDRSHQAKVRRVRVHHEGSRLVLDLEAKGDCELELQTALAKGELFERLWGKSLEFRVGKADKAAQSLLEFNSLA